MSEPGSRFHTTQWTMIRQATGDEDDEARAARERFCSTYWPPLYSFLRRDGHDPEDAADLVQGFFLRFLEREDLSRVQPQESRLRSYLLRALKNHRATQREHDAAQRRGGGRTVLSWDAEEAERRHAQEPADPRNPDAVFERRWAETVLATAMERLREERRQRGREELFEALAPWVDRTAGPDHDERQRLAGAHGSSSTALKVALHRLRQRFAELVRREVAETVGGPEEVEDELDRLFAALSS